MKAIILAAGRGSRLGSLTRSIAKCMVPVSGQPLLQRAVATLRDAGVSDIVVIRGYAAQSVEAQGARYVENHEWASTNILGSLFSAPYELAGETLVVYGDILFGRRMVEVALAHEGEIVPVADLEWRTAYEGREQHPVDEAEKIVLTGRQIAKIGKRNIEAAAAHAEFAGVLKLGGGGAERLASAYQAAAAEHRKGPFITAASLSDAYLTDLLQFMVDRGERIEPALVSGGWREIDTPEDLQRAEAWLNALG